MNLLKSKIESELSCSLSSFLFSIQFGSEMFRPLIYSSRDQLSKLINLQFGGLYMLFIASQQTMAATSSLRPPASILSKQNVPNAISRKYLADVSLSY